MNRTVVSLLGVAALSLTFIPLASTVASASSVNTFDQCANNTGTGPCTWTNGDLNASNSAYVEGDSTIQFVEFSGLSPNSAHTVTLQYGSTKSGKHAYDFLDTFNTSESFETFALVCSQNSVSGCPTSPESTQAMPMDTSGGSGGFDATYAGLHGTQTFDMAGGSFSASPTTPTLSGSLSSDSDVSYTLSFTVDSSGSMCSGTGNKVSCNVVLAFGAHIASELDWGFGNGAGSIPGSPYHVRVTAFDGGSIGNRDNQMAASAVLPTPTVTTLLSSSSITVGGSVTDTASFSGANSPTGSVTFNVYSGTDATACSGTVVATKTATISGGSATTSAFTLGVGNYEFQAVYPGDANNNAGTSACGSEPLVVNQATPLVTTALTPATGAIDDSHTFTDVATVSGGDSPTGTVTFKVYSGSDSSACVDANLISAQTQSGVSLSGGTASSSAFGPLTVGTYEVQATYSGDTNNASETSACGTETVTVTSTPPPPPNDTGTSTVTSPSDPASVTVPATFSDTATVSIINGGTQPAPTGTVTFVVYAGNGTDVCTSGNVVDSATVPLASGSASSGNFTEPPGSYEIVANYSGDANNNPSSSACGDEPMTVNQAQPSVGTVLSPDSGSVTAPASFSDTANITNGDSPTGTVTFNVYAGTDGTACSGEGVVPVATATGTVSGASATSGAFTLLPGSYEVQAVYSGDANNAGATSTCGDEAMVVNKAQPSIGTVLSSTSVTVPGTFTDTANVTGGDGPTGSVTFYIYPGSSETVCDSDVNPVYTSDSIPLTDGSATTGSITLGAGSYEVQAVYSGDTNNYGATSSCGSELVTVVTTTTSTTTTSTTPPTTQPPTTLATTTTSTTTTSTTTTTLPPVTTTIIVTPPTVPPVTVPVSAPSTGFGGLAKTTDNGGVLAVSGAMLLAGLLGFGLVLFRRRRA